MTIPTRPDCFEFAMSFLGDPEETVIRSYIKALEARAALAGQPAGPKDEEAIEARFQQWWYDDGSGMPPQPTEDTEEHVRRVSRIAWHNGAYVGRYDCAPPLPEVEG